MTTDGFFTVLGHHQHPEVKDQPSVIIQLPPTEDEIGLSWNIQKQKVSVDDQF